MSVTRSLVLPPNVAGSEVGHGEGWSTGKVRVKGNYLISTVARIVHNTIYLVETDASISKRTKNIAQVWS